MNPVLIAIIGGAVVALLLSTRKKALASGTEVKRGTPYDRAGGTTYDPNAPEGPLGHGRSPEPATGSPPGKKKPKKFGSTLVVDPMRERLKGLTQKAASGATAKHFGLHTRPMGGLPAEGDTDAWFALYNSDRSDELAESVRIAMRAVTRHLTSGLETYSPLGKAGGIVPAWTPELSWAGGIGATQQRALIDLATAKRQTAAAKNPALYAAIQLIESAPPGWSNKGFREAWAAATVNEDGTSPELDALYASVPTLERNPDKESVMEEWRNRTEIRTLEPAMVSVFGEALAAALPDPVVAQYGIPPSQAEVDAIAEAIWFKLQTAHSAGARDNLWYDEMFQAERDLVRKKVKKLWNEAAAAVANPNILETWNNISMTLRDAIVNAMLGNILRGEPIYGGRGPKPGVYGVDDFIQVYLKRPLKKNCSA